jgi:hypothetical protein
VDSFLFAAFLFNIKKLPFFIYNILKLLYNIICSKIEQIGKGLGLNHYYSGGTTFLGTYGLACPDQQLPDVTDPHHSTEMTREASPSNSCVFEGCYGSSGFAKK